MTILAMILRILGLAPEIIQDVLTVVNHAQNPANVTAAQAAVKSSTVVK